jgi:phage FluMu gp28-like protein
MRIPPIGVHVLYRRPSAGTRGTPSVSEPPTNDASPAPAARPVSPAEHPSISAEHPSISAEPAPFVPLLPYQRADLEAPERFVWNCWARQTGKSFTKSLRRLLRGLARRRNQVFLSAGERQCRELMDKTRQHCELLKIACEAVESGSFAGLACRHLQIHLPGGVRIIGLPANPQTARGFTGDVLLDEFAMHAEDRAIWAAIFPTLLRGDGELDVASTPSGSDNVFAELRGNPLFRHSTVRLTEAVRDGLDVDVELLRRAMNDDLLFRQEFLCEFLDEANVFLSMEHIAGCCDAGLVLATSPAELAGIEAPLFVGVDIGRHRDLTVLWVLARGAAPQQSRDREGATSPEPQASACAASPEPRASACAASPEPQASACAAAQGTERSGRAVPPAFTRGPERPTGLCRDSGGTDVLRTVAVFECAGMPFAEQSALLAEVLRLPQVRRCCIDAGGMGMPLAEAAVEAFGPRRVEAVTLLPALRNEIATALRVAAESRRIRIPDDEHIRRDWHSVERHVSTAGALRLIAPRREGSHADRFWGAALALRAAGHSGPNRAAESLPIRPARFACDGSW